MATTYTDQDVTKWLEANLPQWKLVGGYLERTYRTENWQRTVLLAGGIAFLGEAAWHHPDLLLSYPKLKVRLRTHEADGITDKDFELARRIESTVTWQPAEDSVFTGPPGGWIR